MKKERGNIPLIIVILIILICVAFSFIFIGIIGRTGWKVGKIVRDGFEEAANVLANSKTSNDYDNRIQEILADDVEIEKKWLIDKNKIPYNLNSKDVNKYDILQTYICFDPEMRVRKYNNGTDYEFTIKTNMTNDGLIRDETNMEINEAQYNNLMENKKGITIHKTRYQFYENGEVIAIDIFHDELDGLAYMEIEFPNKEEAEKFETPDWVIKDVTDNIKYKNGHLARYGIPEE